MKLSKLGASLLLATILLQTTSCKKEKDDNDGDNNTINAEKLACSYSTTKTLTNRNPTGVDYYADCIVDVSGNGILIVEPGTTIAFANGGGIYVGGNGAIKAVGSSADKVKFTTADNVSSWAGISIASNNTSNELSNCIIERAGNGTHSSLDRVDEPAAVQVAGYAKVYRTTITNSVKVGLAASAYGATVTLNSFEQNTFNGNGSYPLVLEKDLIMDLDLSTCTYTGNFYQNIKLICSSAASTATALLPAVNHTWRDAGVPYYVNQGFEISNGASLTLEQGVELLFDGDGFLHIVNGNSYLKTNGTSGNPVRMGGTNSTAGFWDGLMFETTSTNNRLNYTVVSDAGNNVYFYGDTKSAIRVGSYFKHASLELSNVTIQNTDGCAVSVYDADGNGQIPAGTTFTESGSIYSGNSGNNLCVE